MELPMESVNLGCYVKNDPNVELVGSPKKMYECEKLPFAIEVYPELDLKFFEITQEHKGFKLPLFGIYPIGEASKCVIKLEREDADIMAARMWQAYRVALLGPLVGEEEEPEPKKKFAPGIDLEGYPEQIASIIRAQLKKELTPKMFKGHSEDERLVFTSQFHGIVPKDTKDKIESAERVLDNISIVAEAHDWQCTKEVITRDPLVIGSVGERWFLIDHFDTTGAEDYIIAKFSDLKE